MGEATDITMLNKDSLVVEKRSVKQGPVDRRSGVPRQQGNGIDEYERKRAAGVGGYGRPSCLPMPPERHKSIACLPLADGFSATFRNFDVQKQKAKVMQLQVIGIGESHRSSGHVRRLQGRNHLGRRWSRENHHVDRERFAQTRQGFRRDSADGRRGDDSGVGGVASLSRAAGRGRRPHANAAFGVTRVSVLPQGRRTLLPR